LSINRLYRIGADDYDRNSLLPRVVLIELIKYWSWC